MSSSNSAPLTICKDAEHPEVTLIASWNLSTRLVFSIDEIHFYTIRTQVYFLIYVISNMPWEYKEVLLHVDFVPLLEKIMVTK